MAGPSAVADLGGDNGDIVKDTSTAAFRKDVIAESAKTPVLVDFWAPWCEPCKQLTPILEKVVRATGGKAMLVKMNIDEHPQVAGQLGVQSIPAVIAFQNGQPIDGFMGALPESQIKGFVERLVGPVGDQDAGYLEEAALAHEQGDDEAAVQIYSALVAKDPANAKAIAGLASVYLSQGALPEAQQILDAAPEKAAADPSVVGARAALDLAAQAGAVGDISDLRRRVEADPNDRQARFDLALSLNSRGARAEAAEALLDILQKDRAWNDAAARKQLLQFFEAWGPMDPDTIAARRRLSALLFS